MDWAEQVMLDNAAADYVRKRNENSSTPHSTPDAKPAAKPNDGYNSDGSFKSARSTRSTRKRSTGSSTSLTSPLARK